MVATCRVISVAPSGLRHHFDGVTRALLEAHGAAGALVVVVAIPPARPQLDDGVLRTGGIAVVALEAVAAGKTALRLVAGRRLRQAGDDLLEAADALRGGQGLLRAGIGVAVDRQLQHVEGHSRMLRRLPEALAAEPGVDMPRGTFAVADRNGDRLLTGHHVSAGEDSRMAGHHV